VVVPDREAPDAARDLSAPAGLVSGLADQLDLRPLPVGPGLHVYEDAAWRPSAGPPPPSPSGGPRAAELALETLLWLAAVGGLVLSRPGRHVAAAGVPAAGAGPGQQDRGARRQ
jgi:hypothetical protein